MMLLLCNENGSPFGAVYTVQHIQRIMLLHDSVSLWLKKICLVVYINQFILTIYSEVSKTKVSYKYNLDV